MIPERFVLVSLAGAWMSLFGVQSQPPVFRAEAEAVTVSVSVRQGNVPAQGLTTSAFRLFDNDVLQEVTAVSQDSVPTDVSIVVDTSGSAFPDLNTAREAVRGMTAFLRPVDRVRVLTMGNAVVNALPWQVPPQVDTSRIQLVPGQISLVSDAVLMAMFHRTSPERRHLVVALTDGEDLCSLVSGESLRNGADRSGAVLHWISVQLKRGQARTLSPTEGVHAYCRTTSTPFDARPFLSDSVRRTGGTVHTAWYGADRVAVEAFDRIFDDFRQSYILHYIPRGVERSGWHRLRVEITAGHYSVRARPGYWATVP